MANLGVSHSLEFFLLQQLHIHVFYVLPVVLGMIDEIQQDGHLMKTNRKRTFTMLTISSREVHRIMTYHTMG